MSTSSVHDVAAYLISKFGVLGTMKLEKLAYYCQAWWVARNEGVLFPEPLQAWRMGPVCPDLYVRHRRQNHVQEWKWGNVDLLQIEKLQHIDSVVDVYGAYSGFSLGNMTHQELPWTAAMSRGGQNAEIRVEDMREYFRALDQ